MNYNISLDIEKELERLEAKHSVYGELEYVNIAKYLISKCLLHSYSESGVSLWWDRTRYQLDGQTPLEVLYKGKFIEIYKLVLSMESFT